MYRGLDSCDLRNKRDRKNEFEKVNESLLKSGITQKVTAQMVDLVEEKGLKDIPDDAVSLIDWLKRADKYLLPI